MTGSAMVALWARKVSEMRVVSNERSGIGAEKGTHVGDIRSPDSVLLLIPLDIGLGHISQFLFPLTHFKTL